MTSTEGSNVDVVRRPRVVLLCDDAALQVYGPVMRRLCIGLLDEVEELNLFCLGESDYLDFAPCPPVRVIREVRKYYETSPRTECVERRVDISSPRLPTLETLVPHRRDIRLAGVLAEYKPALIHALQDHLAHQGRNLARILNIPLLVSVLARDGEAHFHHAGFSEGILPSCSYVARRLRKRHVGAARHIYFVPIGTHITETTSSFVRPDCMPQLVCCSPYQHGQDLDMLINALRILADSNQDFAVALSGSGRLEQHLRHKVNQLKLNECVHFIDPIDKLVEESDALKAILSAYDIFVVPHKSPIWQPELLEAMSVGNTIVAPRGTAPDLIRHEQTGLNFEPGNTQSLAQVLRKAIHDRPASRQLGINAQQYLKKHFLVSHMVSRLSKVYAQTVRSFQTASVSAPSHNE